MAPIGQSVERTGGAEILARAKARAALVPDCLVEARRIANTVSAGWHGRRRRGIGENFWQFRPYSPGEDMARIDWRRSAATISILTSATRNGRPPTPSGFGPTCPPP